MQRLQCAMCKSIYGQTNSSAIVYWQEHWGCVYLKREGGAILMLPFFLFHFCLGTRPGEGRSRACWSNLWKGKWGCEFYLTHVSFSPSVPSHNPFEQSEHGIHLRSPLGEDINLKDEIHLASAKKRRIFFIFLVFLPPRDHLSSSHYLVMRCWNLMALVWPYINKLFC